MASRPAHRPTKLTPEVKDKILHAIRMGCYASVAAQAAGISEATFYLWINRGEREQASIYSDFVEALKIAEAQAEARCVEMVQLAAPDNWQAAMTLMERRWSERWRRRDQLDFRRLSDEELIKRTKGSFDRDGAPWLELPAGEDESRALSE